MRPSRVAGLPRSEHGHAYAEIDEYSAEHAVDPNQHATGLSDQGRGFCGEGGYSQTPDRAIANTKIAPSKIKASGLLEESAETN